MKRDIGYYWIMQSPNSDWEVAYFNGAYWLIDNTKTYDKHIHTIHHSRIKTPYEVF
jgi:hypothetical protein